MNFNLGHINKIASVSVVLKDDGHHFNVVVLKRKKGLLEIVKKEKRIATVKELVKFTGNYVSFILHFTGKGILNRKLENRPNYRSNMLFDSDSNAFYFTDVITDNYVFSSMIRKSVVEDVYNQFNTKLNHIISISTGPFIVASIESHLNLKELLVDEYVLQMEQDQLIDFTKDTSDSVKNYPLDGKLIDHKEIAMVAHGALFFEPKEKVVLPEENSIFIDAKKESEQKNIFIRFGASMILFYLVLLFANMMYLDVLSKQINSNYEKLSLSESTLQQIGTLNEEKSRKEKMLISSGLLNEKFLSFYLMEISNSVPNEISLSTISIRPFQNEIKKNFKIEIDDSHINILGDAPSSAVLSEWIKNIERKDWVSKIDIQNYFYSKGRGEFELKIEIINV